MRSWLAILVMLAACTDQGVERLTSIKSEVCACKTVSCAEQAMKGVPQEAIKSTHRTQAIARDMMDCLAKLEAAERPTTDPDAEDSAEEPPALAPPATAPPAGAPRSAAPAAPLPGAPPGAAPGPPPAGAPRTSSPAAPPAGPPRTATPAPAKKP